MSTQMVGVFLKADHSLKSLPTLSTAFTGNLKNNLQGIWGNSEHKKIVSEWSYEDLEVWNKKLWTELTKSSTKTVWDISLI